MTVESEVRLLAGSLVLIGLALGLLVSPWFFLLAGFVGANLAQSSFTHVCPAETVFRRMGRPRTTGERPVPEIKRS